MRSSSGRSPFALCLSLLVLLAASLRISALNYVARTAILPPSSEGLETACDFAALLDINVDKCAGSGSRRSLAYSSNRSMLAQYMDVRSKIDWVEMNRYSPQTLGKEFPSDQICIHRNASAFHKAAIGFLIPKDASSTFRRDNGALADADGLSLATAGWTQHACEAVLEQNPSWATDPSIVRFAVLRDPFVRFVSAFNQAKHESNLKTHQGRDFNPAAKSIFAKFKSDNAEGIFEEFIADVLPKGDIHKVAWTEPQSVLLLQRAGHFRKFAGFEYTPYEFPALDFLVSLDTLDEHTPELRSILGIKNDVVPKHENIKAGKLDSKFVSKDAGIDMIKKHPALLQRFCELYAADFILMGYDLPTGCTLKSSRYTASLIPELWDSVSASFGSNSVWARHGGHSRFLNKAAAEMWESQQQHDAMRSTAK